jgi:hypothetical protein
MRNVSVGLLSALLAACSFNRPLITGKQAMQTIPDKLIQEEEFPEVTVETANWADDVFRVRSVNPSHELPKKHIESVSVTEAGLYDMIQLLFDGTQLAVTFEGGTENMRRYGPVTTYKLQGDLTRVMNQLAKALGFFWSVHDNMVIIEPEQQFMISLPPILNDDNLAGITNTLQYLGVRDSYLDRNERQIVFRANRKALDSVEGYMKRLRESRSMIVYDVQILQVDLKDGQRMGIQWSGYNKRATDGAAAFSSVSNTDGNTGFAVTLIGKSFRAATLVEFLNTQGSVKSLSKPRIGIMSGTRGSLRVGQSTTIVSKVGRDLTSTVSQTTVETKEVKTGLELNLFGEEHDRTVYTRINLSVTELLRLNRFQALGTDLTLPDIADRDMRTQIRSRPGDTIILGGITINRADMDRSLGVAINESSSQSNQSELVIVLKPRLIVFRPLSARQEASSALPTALSANAVPQIPAPRDENPPVPRDENPPAPTDSEQTAGGMDLPLISPVHLQDPPSFSRRVPDMVFRTPLPPNPLRGATP